MDFIILEEPYKVTTQEFRIKRQNFVNTIIKTRNKRGIISFFFDDQVITFQSYDCKLALNNILLNLQRGTPSSAKEQRILELCHKNKLTIEEILQLKINFKVNVYKQESQRSTLLKQIPSKGGGVYIITFPNNKKYIGSSKNIKNRLESHLQELFGPTDSKQEWYARAKEGNPGLQPIDLKIETIIGRGVFDLEKRLLREVTDRDNYYNSVWYDE